MRGYAPTVRILLLLGLALALAAVTATAATPRQASGDHPVATAAPAGWLAPLLDLWHSWWSPSALSAADDAGATATTGSGSGGTGSGLGSTTDPPTDPECDPGRQEGPCVDPNG